MSERRFKARFVNKHAVEADWIKAVNFTPLKGEIIVYDVDATYNYERFKIGDGETTVNALPFADDSIRNYIDTELEDLSGDIQAVGALVGDKSVSDQISNAIASKSDNGHIHDDRYYTESEINTKLNAKSNTGHTHGISDITDLGESSVSHATTADTANAVAWGNVTGKPSTYTPASHNHAISEITNLQDTLNAKVPTTRTVNGKALSTNITLKASDVGADATGSAASALTNANLYTDAEIAEWVGDKPVADQISDAISGKADTSHTHSISNITNLQDELDSKYEKPSTGIPKTDLASAVQTSLGKADSAIQSLAGYATESYVDGKVSSLVDSAPETLNTLNELAAALGDDPNFATTVANQIGNKVDKVSGKGLSTNDYTTTEKNKLSGIESGANKTVVDTELSGTSTNPVQNKVVNTAINSLKTLVGDTAVSTQISNAIASKADTGHTHDDRYYTETEINTKLAGKSDTSHTHSAYVNQNAFSNVVVGSTTIAADSTTDTITLVAGSNVTLTPDSTNDKITIAATDTTYGEATTSAAGLMSAADKTKLNGIATGANKITVDTALSSTSTNPVQNKAVQAAISSLNTLVGDTPVATQITSAIQSNAYVLPTASSTTLGGVKTTSTVTSTSGMIACPIISGVPYYKNTKVEAKEDTMIVVSATEPTSPTTGMLWFDIS